MEAVTFLTSLLREELKESTGLIKIDMENGSYYKIRKLVTAIQILSDDPADINVSMEFQEETWQVIIHPNNINQIEEKISLLKNELVEIWEQKGFQHHETIELSQELDKEILAYQKLKYPGIEHNKDESLLNNHLLLV